VVLIETSIFTREIDRLLSEDEYRALQEALVRNPQAGAVIPGSGGCRKLRWGKGGHGKRGGIRVIYHPMCGRLLLLLAYDKRRVANLSRAELRQLSELVAREMENTGDG
jgi:hypothetical protein